MLERSAPTLLIFLVLMSFSAHFHTNIFENKVSALLASFYVGLNKLLNGGC